MPQSDFNKNVWCILIIELEDKLETNQAVQEELKDKVDQTAAAVEDVKTTMTEGKQVYTSMWERWSSTEIKRL